MCEQKPYPVWYFVSAQDLSGIVWTLIPYLTLQFRDNTGAASLRYRDRAEITVVMCEQMPYTIWPSCRRKSNAVQCEHSLKQLLLLRKGEYDACEELFYFNF